jgi:glycerol-3-phosphate dehydrogenase (NAD(P)+)
MKIAVIGAGAWGTALAIQFGKKHSVSLWGRDTAQLTAMAATRTNAKYLPSATIADNILVTPNFVEAIEGADLALIVTSTAGLADSVKQIQAQGKSIPVIWACKGFERASGKLPHETVTSILPTNAFYGALSGPSFADEVAKGLPCALTLAANDFAFATEMAAALNGNALRVYSSPDLIGVELGGALKNVMAIAAGIGDGLQLGLNARAALITRGLAEMVRLGTAMGGRAETFMGLTGVGDLILTATGNLSRNRKVGMLLAEGKSLDDILAQLGHVAEGVNSAQTALRLAKQYAIAMPITEAVNAVLFAGANPQDAVKSLLGREVKAES